MVTIRKIRIFGDIDSYLYKDAGVGWRYPSTHDLFTGDGFVDEVQYEEILPIYPLHAIRRDIGQHRGTSPDDLAKRILSLMLYHCINEYVEPDFLRWSSYGIYSHRRRGTMIVRYYARINSNRWACFSAFGKILGTAKTLKALRLQHEGGENA